MQLNRSPAPNSAARAGISNSHLDTADVTRTGTGTCKITRYRGPIASKHCCTPVAGPRLRPKIVPNSPGETEEEAGCRAAGTDRRGQVRRRLSRPLKVSVTLKLRGVPQVGVSVMYRCVSAGMRPVVFAALQAGGASGRGGGHLHQLPPGVVRQRGENDCRTGLGDDVLDRLHAGLAPAVIGSEDSKWECVACNSVLAS